LPCIEGSLNYDHKEKKDTESEIGSVWVGVTKRLVANNNNNASNKQQASESAEKVSEAVN